jgi:hypothetical protein
VLNHPRTGFCAHQLTNPGLRCSGGAHFMFVVLLVAVMLPVHHATAEQSIERDRFAHFENNVRPLLVTHCIKCHGPQKAESDLRLDTLETTLRGGTSGPAIVPGNPAESLMIQAVRHLDGMAMPPDETLDAHAIAALEQWVKAGASWPDGMNLTGNDGPQLRDGPITDAERAFWSFQPIADATPPTVKSAQTSENAIDQFVNEKLTEAGLRMRSAASRRTLLRRATFDLTGLPPSPKDIAAFLAADSPNAFQTVVDRLLSSPAYGERWGRHWLDVVRYADTAGETADYPTPLAWKYRNWVIDAFNQDIPYDRFVREQIAGDIFAERMVSAPTDVMSDEDLQRYRDVKTATGFIAISRRFGFDVENYHNLTIQDTLDTVGQAVLDLSIGCARCHDHKFDPISSKDYYSWYGIFESTRYSFPGSEEKQTPLRFDS